MMSENLPPCRSVSTLSSWDTEYSADSVEWCPFEPFQNYFVCANYQLKKNEDAQSNVCERLGRILLFKITPKDGLELKQSIDTAAVLDQKWCHSNINGLLLLGVVNAKKALEIYKLNPESQLLEFVTSFVLDTADETLILSLDWSTGKFVSDTPEIICSDSKGDIHRLIFSKNELSLDQSWHGHDFEAWISAFYYWDTNICFSGGDDCKFLKYDRRVGVQPVAVNKSHEAGVTSMHSNSRQEYVLATGSYDEKIRLWDLRFMKTPKDSVKVPGPVWRVKWDPFSSDFLLTACMLGGVHVINTKSDNLEVCESYYGHKDISYGADWCFLNTKEVAEYNEEGNVIIGTCSFYDHLLCISKLALPIKR